MNKRNDSNQPIDWAALVEELIARHGSEMAVAKVIGTSQPTIHNLRRRKTTTPLYPTGRALIELHDAWTAAAHVLGPEGTVR